MFLCRTPLASKAFRMKLWNPLAFLRHFRFHIFHHDSAFISHHKIAAKATSAKTVHWSLASLALGVALVPSSFPVSAPAEAVSPGFRNPATSSRTYRRLKHQTRNVHLNVMLIALQYMSIMTQQWWSSHDTPLERHSPGISGNSLDVLLRFLSALVTPEIRATLRYLTVASWQNTPFSSMIFPAINLHLVWWFSIATCDCRRKCSPEQSDQYSGIYPTRTGMC